MTALRGEVHVLCGYAVGAARAADGFAGLVQHTLRVHRTGFSFEVLGLARHQSIGNPRSQFGYGDIQLRAEANLLVPRRLDRGFEDGVGHVHVIYRRLSMMWTERLLRVMTPTR